MTPDSYNIIMNELFSKGQRMLGKYSFDKLNA